MIVVRAERGPSSHRPGVVTDAGMDRIRSLVPGVVEHTIADTISSTVALADPGASLVAELLAEFAARCSV